MYTVNRDSPISEAIALCGGENVFAAMPVLSGVVDPEAVLAAAPEVVAYGREDDGAGIRRFWARWPELGVSLVEVEASLLARQSPRVLDGVEQLCAGLERVRQARSAKSSVR